ncbi:hypothetical protein [Methylotenera versatilis]|uniref:hypothetical protein n=1 Tax=Methylotenera versatilis TaxID=1055487 RepID=UPI000646943E|nr:hypothetical protein [Methylotenera versatilis]
MRSSLIKAAVIGALALMSMHTYALAPFVDLPASGTATSSTAPTFPAVAQPLGTTAYKIFWRYENFGSGIYQPFVQNNTDASLGDTAGPTGGNATLSPSPYNTAGWGGASNTASTAGSITENGVIVANYTSRVWRNASLGQCVYGFQIVNVLNDYLPGVPGNQFIKFNDIALGGFSGRTVDAAYWRHAIAGVSPVYRAGLTYTAVQHRATPLWSAGPNNGYVALPLTTPAFSLSINGINTTSGGSPTVAQQSASLNDNWVNFTLDIFAYHDEGFHRSSSPWLYVHSSCAPTGALVSSPNAVRVRQSYQGGAVDGFREFGVTGYTPANNGAAVLPAPVNPY